MAYQLIKVSASEYREGPGPSLIGSIYPQPRSVLLSKSFQALQAENVEYVVAPYEADAQLAYLEREGIVDGIITEDSDLLVFGCRQVGADKMRMG